MLGAPASLKGSELSRLLGSGPSLCPVPMPKFSPPIIMAHNALRVSLIHLEHLAVSGWPDADFYGAVNFRFTEFSEVRPRRSCLTMLQMVE